MIYTPLSSDEMEVVIQLVVESFNFVTKGDPEANSGKKQPASSQPVSQQQDLSLICSTCRRTAKHAAEIRGVIERSLGSSIHD